jgi:hypothetical protein
MKSTSRGVVVAVALLAGVGTAPSVLPRDPTPGEVSEFRQKSVVDLGPDFGTPLERFLFERAASEPPRSLAARVSEEFDLPLEAARHLALGSLIRGASWEEDEEDVAAALDEAEKHLRRAVELAPSTWVAVEELAKFYMSSRNCRAAELVRLGQAWGDVRDAALRLREMLIGTQCGQPLLAALQEHPSDLELIALLAEQHSAIEGPYGIAIRKYAEERFVHGTAWTSPEAQVQIARSYIASLLYGGAARAGIREYESLPEPLRARVWADAEPSSDRVFARGYQAIAAPERSAFQIELSAAYLRAGDRDRARALLGSASLEPLPRPDTSLKSDPEHCVALLRAVLGGKVGDPYALLLEVGALEREDPAPRGCAHSPTWTGLIARFAAQSSYPDIERYFANRTSFTLADERFRDEDEQFGPVFAAAPVELQQAIAWVSRDLVEADSASTDSIRDTADDRTAISRAILAAIPRLAKGPFVEHRLPQGVQPVATLESEIEQSIDEAGSKSPPRFWRHERSGDTEVGIAVTQDYDPMGEVGGGAYWIHLSRDRGTTWQPIYTGLRDRFPYVVRRESRLPILSGDTVQLEVAIDEVDTETITFPPIDLGAKRHAEGLFVSAPVSELIRDTDSDGLTDLAEDALLTDFANADTDGDFVPDGNDPLPHVARGFGDAKRSAALAPALELMFGESLRARVVPIDRGVKYSPAEELRYAAGIAAAFSHQHALFLVGDRSDFSGIVADYPIIVLSPREARAVYESRSVFYPASLSLFVLDHDRKRGLIIWSANWTGGTIRLTRSHAGWKAESISNWIT